MREYGLVKTPMSVSIESTEESTLYRDMGDILDLKQVIKNESNLKNIEKLSIVTENLTQIKDILNANLINPTLRPTSFKAIKMCLESFNKHYDLNIDTDKFNMVNYGGLYSKKEATKICLESLDEIETSLVVSNSQYIQFGNELRMLDSLIRIREELKSKNNDLQVNVNNFFASNSKEELIGLELPNSNALQHIVNGKDVVNGKIQALSIFNNLQSYKSTLSSANHHSIVLEVKNHLNNLVNEFDIFKLDIGEIMGKFLTGARYTRNNNNNNNNNEYCSIESTINNTLAKVTRCRNYDTYDYFFIEFNTKVSPEAILVSLNKEESNNLLVTASDMLDNTVVNNIKEIIELFIKVDSFIEEVRNRHRSLRKEPKANLNSIDSQIRSFIEIMIEILSFENMVMLAISGYVGHSLKFIQNK